MTPSDPVLRVLNGRLAGTEKPIPAKGSVSIGHQYWQDVVIRDAATRGIAVEMALDADGAAQITVLEGEATLLGSTLAAGATAILPPYVPFTIGGVAIAWGQRAGERWNEATGLAGTVPALPETPPSASDHALAVVERAGEGLSGLLTRRRLRVGAAAVGVLLLASVTMPVVDALELRGSPETRVTRALADAGLKDLRVSRDSGSGGVVVTGVVGNEGLRQRAAKALEDSGVTGTLSVQTSADLARAVADVARMHGLQSVAKPIGRTAVELRVTPLEPEQESRLAQAVRGDVRALTQLALRDDLPPVETTPVKTVQDATKKVSTVVAGDPAYIQTVDGARYFSGALMPSGHRLVGIQANTVILEKNGRETRVNF